MFTVLTISAIILLQVYVETTLQKDWHHKDDLPALKCCKYYTAIKSALNKHLQRVEKGLGGVKYVAGSCFSLSAVIMRMESKTQAVLISNFEEKVYYYCVDGLGFKDGTLIIEKIHKEGEKSFAFADPVISQAILYEAALNEDKSGKRWDVIISDKVAPIDFNVPC